MNKYLDIIPTPKYCSFTSGDEFRIGCVSVKGENSCVINTSLSILEKDCPFDGTLNLVICNGEANIDKNMFTENELDVFEQKYSKEQGYIIKIKNGTATVAAYSDIGCAYGIVTLSQIIGKSVDELVVCDFPDFKLRGVKWTIWAETGIWSYDFGDGAEAIKKRVIRKLDMLMKYKINYIHADAFGFDTERFPEYADIMRTVNDEARKRGIHIATGGYAMSYGMAGYKGTYQGKDFYNRKSFPDGEIYDCIGTYDAYRFIDNKNVDRSERLSEVRARNRGTCLSNKALLEEKMKEITYYLKSTHAGALSLHNMDAHEIHPELWLTRCEDCRKKWPNDDLFAPDGCAGAFAYYFDAIMSYIRSVKDGDFDAGKHTLIRMAAPGYLYAETTSDEDFDSGVKFWSCVTKYMKNTENFSVGFREEFFYHDQNVPRAQMAESMITNAMTIVGYFPGGDGFYDEKLFAPAACLNYIMKGYDGIICENGNAFQEPLQIYNAEYLWNSTNSGFFNVSPKPDSQEEFLKIFYDMINSRFRPGEIYGEGGFIDIICQKLYGEKHGKQIAEVYKISGKNGEPPIPCASNVDIYTNFTKIVYPMRWDNKLETDEIVQKCERFEQCSVATQSAYEVLKGVLCSNDFDKDIEADITWLCECFCMGKMLCKLLSEYMQIFALIDTCFKDSVIVSNEIKERLKNIKKQIAAFDDYIASIKVKPLDKFGGPYVRRKEMAEFLRYNVEIMESSVAQNQRIPDNVNPLPTKEWW